MWRKTESGPQGSPENPGGEVRSLGGEPAAGCKAESGAAPWGAWWGEWLRRGLPAGHNCLSLAENNLWGLTQHHAQMGLNECGDGNDDDYLNSVPSLHHREATAASVIWLGFRGDPPPEFVLHCLRTCRQCLLPSQHTNGHVQQSASYSGGLRDR